MRNLNLEFAFLCVFSVVFLGVGLGVFDGVLSHKYPVGYFASDAFFHQSESEYLRDQGVIKYSLPSMEGGRKDVYDIHPPFVFEATGLLSRAAGLEMHDTIYFFVQIMLLLVALVIYIIIRKFNRSVAILSLPITILVFTHPFSQVINFGQWLFIAGALFMVASFWAMSQLDLKYSFIPLSFFLGATALAHQPELLFAGIVLVFYLVARALKEKKLVYAVPVITAGIISFALSIYSLNLFRLTWLQTYFEDAKLGLQSGASGVFEKGFSDVSLYGSLLGFSAGNLMGIIAGLLVAGGFLLALFLVFKEKKNSWPAWIGFYFLFIGYLTFLGLSKRAFSHRWLWHFYFAFFFGLAIYYLAKLVIKNWNVAYAVGISILLLVAFTIPVYGKTKGSLMDTYNWEAMKWARTGLPEDGHVHVFEMGGLQQSSTLYNLHRVPFIVHRNSYQSAVTAQEGSQVNSLQDIKIIDTYEFGLASAYSHLLCDQGFLNYGYYHSYIPEGDSVCHDEFGEPSSPPRMTKLCDMEYIYMVLLPLQNNDFVNIYHHALYANLSTKPWIKQIYQNQAVKILHNENPGVDCLG